MCSVQATVTVTGLPSGLTLKKTADKDAAGKTTVGYRYTIEGVPTELADVIIVLCEVASDHGIGIREAVDAKMARNRLRKWRRTAAGNFQHVEDEQ